MNGNVEITTDPLPTGWQRRKLGEICQVNPRRPSNLQLDANQLTTFVPMAAVDATSGTVSCAETKLFSEVSRGYTYFEEQDVLFAKITPCMENGKHIIARNLVHGIGFGTTEFHVVRPGPEIIPEWVHKYLRQQRILLQAKKHFRGAVGQQRLPKEFLADLSIPLPPLAEQERIVRILDEKLAVIDKAKQAAETQIEATNALPQAYLREQIPSYEDSLPNGWRWLSLGEVCREDKKTVKPNDESRSQFPYMSLEHVESETGIINISAVLNGYAQETLSNTFAFSSKHVLYGKLGPHLNKVALPEFEGQCTTELIPLIPEKVTRSYLACVLRRPYTVEFAMRRKTGSRMPRTDMRAFMKMPIPFPPLAEQERIVRILDEKLAAIDKAKQASNTRLDTINAMSAAYLRRAFAGEL